MADFARLGEVLRNVIASGACTLVAAMRRELTLVLSLKQAA